MLESDKEIFLVLYEERQMLFYMARKIVRSDTEAEDAVQTCFMRLVENFPKYRHLPYENLVKVCCGITRFIAIDMAREYQKEGEYLQGVEDWEQHVRDMEPDVLDKLIARQDEEIIKAAFMKLTESERELLTLRCSLDLTSQEIGDLLGVSAAAVRKKMMKCRKKMALMLKREQYGKR